MKIGLTTGVYDLFHLGHKNLILKAATKCDFLLVAVASDWLTTVQKGPMRPEETERVRQYNVQKFIEDNNINGKAFITDLLDFSQLEMIDIVILGEDQRNVRYGNKSTIVIPRTSDISTTKLLSLKI